MDCDGLDFAELAALESDALDVLEAFEDASIPAGTASLDAARRRRALSDAFGLITAT
jgi:hypothetical protein